eukprot:Seg3552.2 transcript_id=Seg3552.2/GoldUCD/mRNA.D3Y31 product=Very-long-chain protein_id=Seg3552.2/GoldUCD/D3Y31
MAASDASSARNAYLIGYNAILWLGWVAILVGLGTGVLVDVVKQDETLTDNESIYQALYSRVELLLKISQTAAVLEIVHCVVRLVPSSPVLTGFQVCSRLFVLWMITDLVPVTQKSPGVVLYLICWTVTEIIRYAYYVLNIIGNVPYPLLWCRYTFFFVLYPMGVAGELMTIWKALPVVKETGILSIQLPNVLNFSFSYYYFLIFVMICYIPIFPQLYFHMIAQRKKFIGAKAKKTE